MRTLAQAAMFIAGGLLFAIGLFPFTPLVWLLVVYRVGAPAFLRNVRLEYWQTETLGVILMLAGGFMCWRAVRIGREGRAGAERDIS